MYLRLHFYLQLNVHEQSVSLLEQVQEQSNSDLAEIRSAFERLQIVKEAEKNELEVQVKIKEDQVIFYGFTVTF